jgi:hypothetical protein
MVLIGIDPYPFGGTTILGTPQFESFPPPLHQSSPGALEIATPRDADAQLAELPELAELRAAAVGLVGEQSMSIDLALARCDTLALEVLGFAEKNVFHSFPNGKSTTWGIDDGKMFYFLVVPYTNP